MTRTASFKIRGMDCAEEVAILKREVGPIVGGDDRLQFDVLNGKMTFSTEESSLSDEVVVEAVARTGMRAIPWDQYIDNGDDANTWWTNNGRSVLAISSGTALLAGFAAHALQYGVVEALAGGDEGASHGFPTSSILLYILAIITGGWFIFPKAIYAAKSVRPDMNLLMTVAVIGAVFIQEWFEAASVTFLFTLALLLESWSVGRARRAIETLLDLAPATARFICPKDGDIEDKPVEDVPLNATVLVRPGEKVPLDGIITKGSTSINQAPITGESMPVSKNIGDEVYAGTINEDGAFEFRANKAASDSTLSRIIHMVEEAQSRRARSEQWVEKFARYYTPAMMLLAIAVGIVPPLLFGGDWYAWLYQSLVILVIACPCALVISTPVSIVAGLSSAARQGVLIKGGVYLESPGNIRAIAMDKTGTLTRGEPEVQQIVPLNGHSESELLSRAASLESSSEHPLAKAILRRADADEVDYERAENFQIEKGKGADGDIGGRPFWIGSHRYMIEKGVDSASVQNSIEDLEFSGHTVLFVGNEDHLCGLISVADQIRPESKDAIASIRESGVDRIVMLTGDNTGTAKTVAEFCGIDEYHAELLPEDKVSAVQDLVGSHGAVAMIGDGVNDAPAMATASLGIAMGAVGSDAAIETADIALMSDELDKVAWLVSHSRRTVRTIRQNILFALGLKLVFIVLALFGIATLWMAIAADMGASLLVIFNSLRLLKAKRGE